MQEGRQSEDGVRRWLSERGQALASRPLRLAGGASPRVYFRVTLSDETTRVVMVLPDDGHPADELGSEPSLASDELPFVRVGRWLAKRQVPVPHLEAVDLDRGYLLMEDLGDVRLYDVLERDRATQARVTQYGAALDLLHRFQSGSGDENPGNSRLSAKAIGAEFDEFVGAGLERRQGITLRASERAVAETAFQRISETLIGAPQLLAHRDFQSQNIMSTPRGLVLIDFQDCFLAPIVYDLVALLRDSYVVLPAPAVVTLVQRYFAKSALAQSVCGDGATFERLFWVQTVQRKLKDAGRFVTLAGKGKPGFLKYYPDSIVYVMDALARLSDEPDYVRLAALLAERIPEAAVARRRGT